MFSLCQTKVSLPGRGGPVSFLTSLVLKFSMIVAIKNCCIVHQRHFLNGSGGSYEMISTFSVTRKNCQMSIKVAQNDFIRKMIDFDTFTKLPKNVGHLGKLIVGRRL